jgi:hypothetical protein
MVYVFKKDNPLPPLKGGAHAAKPEKDYEFHSGNAKSLF